MADSELIVRLRGENSDLKAKLAEVTNASKGTASGMDSVFKSALGSIASAIGVTFSIAAVVNFGKASVQAFSESQAAATSLANTISNMGGSSGMQKSIQSMVDNLERMSGFDDSDISGAFRDLYTQTGNSAKATEALNVAMDMAAIEHTTVAAAAQNVHNVMLGLSRSMKNYGMTVREGASDMDYLRELGQKMAGGLSTNLDTVDGKTRKLRTSFDGLKESIGAALAPSITPIVEGLSKFFDNIQLTNDWNEMLWTTGYENFDTLSKLGKEMGAEWRRSFLEAMNGDESLTDVSVGAFDKSSKGKSVAFDPASIASATTSTANAFKAAWGSINMVGGNLPELTKYIGNLRQASTIKQKVTVDVQMTINGGSVTVKNATPVANAIAKAVAPAVQQAVTHGQGWTPPTAIGGGLGAGFQFGGD